MNSWQTAGAGGPRRVRRDFQVPPLSRPYLNRSAHTGCCVAGSVPPVLCPHLKGRPPKHTSVKTALLTEHVPGDQHRGGGGGRGASCPAQVGTAADPRPLWGSRRHILRWILKTQVAHEKTKWAEVWGLGPGSGGSTGESGSRWAGPCGRAGQGG